ncbi:MAG: TonB-dependent receptor [Candidatus Omnitrophota bacterium]
MKKRAFVIMSLLVFVSASLFAQDHGGDIELDKIVVTPTRTGENIKGTTSGVTVFTRRDIENSKADNMKDFIEDTVGLDIYQAGSFGGQVSVFLRGTNSGQTQIMIDNVRVYDPIATNAAFNLAYVKLDNIERIEIVKGPQSVLYGSDAMGGVINIITRGGKGKPGINFLTEGGSYDSHRESIDSSGRIKDFSYSFGISNFKSRGISKFKGTTEKDPYENMDVSLRLDYDINPKNKVGVISHFTDAIYKYDNSIGLKDDPDLKGHEQQTIFTNYIENELTDKWKQRIQFSFMRNYRQDSNDRDTSYPDDYLRDWYIGENQQLDWQHTVKLNRADTIVCGFDWQREKGNYYYYTEYLGGSSETHFPKVLSRTKGYYLQNILNIDDTFRLNTGIRVDDHSYAGTRESYKIDASYLFKTGTRVKGGWGTAFKAPTLYQLHALPDPWFGGGNPNLQPEESQTYEAGFEQNAFSDKLKFQTVYFHTQLKNLIDAKYNPATWMTNQYSNVGKARIFGYENSASFSPFKEIRADAGYTWMDTEDKSNGDELLRRAKNKYFVNLKYIPNEKLDFSLKFTYVGRRSDSANRLLKAYTKLDLNSNYKLNSGLEAFVRMENVTDEVYEEVKGYAEPGRAFYGGVKLSF